MTKRSAVNQLLLGCEQTASVRLSLYAHQLYPELEALTRPIRQIRFAHLLRAGLKTEPRAEIEASSGRLSPLPKY